MIDRYLRAPLVWDYALSGLSSLLVYLLIQKGMLQVPEFLSLSQVASDISTIGLTLTGFILTMLTVLITLKFNSAVGTEESIENLNGMEIFLATRLYIDTVSYLKRAIASLILISLFGYIVRLFLAEKNDILLFYFTIVGTIVLTLTTLRCLIILNKVLEVQKH